MIGNSYVQRGHGRRGRSDASGGSLRTLLAGASMFYQNGDPDGSRARAAGERGRVAAPLPFVRRAAAYAHQDGTAAVRWTPARQRRATKKLRAAGVEVTGVEVTG
jgi:hypothetical protein